MTRQANLPLEEPPKKVSTLYVCSNVHSVEMFSSPKSSKAQPKSTNFISLNTGNTGVTSDRMVHLPFAESMPAYALDPDR